MRITTTLRWRSSMLLALRIALAALLSSVGLAADADETVLSSNPPPRSLPDYERILANDEQTLGPERPDVAFDLSELGRRLYNAARYSEAESLYRRALAIFEKALGPEHPDVAASLSNLAELFRTTGRYAEAEPLYRRALAIDKKNLDPEHPDVATGVNNLAVLLYTTGRYGEAEPLLRRALAIREKALGPDHPDVATSLNNLAELLRTMGRYGEAEPLYRRSLAIDERYLGTDHPAVAIDLGNLAAYLDTTGRYAEAEALYRRALAIKEKAFGADHPGVATSLNNLAQLLAIAGRYGEAEPLSRRALAIDQKAFGPEHPNVARDLNSLAGLLKRTGRYGEAEPLYRRALAIYEKALGQEHPDFATNLGNLADLLRITGRYGEAEALYRRALTIDQKALGSDHPDVAMALNSLGALLHATGRYGEAEPLYRRALVIKEKALGPDNPAVATSLSNLAGLLRSSGRYGEAEALYRRALAIDERTVGPEHADFATSLNGLAHVLKDTGRLSEAMPLLFRAERVAISSGNPETAWVVQDNLNFIYSARGQAALAAFWGKRAVNTIQGLRAGLTDTDRDAQKSFLLTTAIIYRQLSDQLISQGRLGEGQLVLAILKEQEQFDYLQRNPDKDPRAMRLVYTKFERPWVERYERESATLGKIGAEYQGYLRINAQVRTPEQTARLKGLDIEIARAQKRYETFVEELKVAFTRESKPPVEFSVEDTEQLKGLQRQLVSLGHGAVAIHYLVTEKRVRILVTTPQGVFHRDSDITEVVLNASIDRYRKVLENPKLDPFYDAHDLYKYLLEPIEADLEKANARLLMISLDGRLRYLPIAALHDGKQWVAEKYAVAIYTPVTRSNLRVQPRANWRVAGFGVSDGGEGESPLPYVPVELEYVIRRNDADKDGAVPGDIFLNRQVREDVLAEVIHKQLYPVIHLASHFKFALGGTLADSYLLLGKAQRLTLEQFSAPRFAMKGVDLLVLSACQTAMEALTQDGREIEGFGNLAQAQGAQAVLATQWSVNDQSTALLMQEFYAQREGKHRTKAEALQRAQLSLLQGRMDAVMATDEKQLSAVRGAPNRDGVVARRDFSPSATAPFAHPYYWAPFILMGNWL